jgi:SAM-dependent methyltransferase
MSSDGHRAFAWCLDKLGPRADARGMEARRRALVGPSRGLVVEIGAGTGLNLPHYPSAVTSVVAVEPDPHMVKRLRPATARAAAPVRLVRAQAEDTVVCSLVLCSVRDPSRALAEVTRVLAPDGELVFFEHVRSDDPRFARRQDLVERTWGWVGGGCHPNRETVAAIRAAGFAIQDLERWNEPGGMFAKPHVLGRATRAR